MTPASSPRPSSAALDTDVLIAGAGPTGLVLALWLTRRGVRVRIVDKAPEAGTTSRALVVQARTLEWYRQLGLADEVVRRGRKAVAVNLWIAGRKVARMLFGDMGAGISRYPYVLVYPQDEHERMLEDRLAADGVSVERNTELLDFDGSTDVVRARLKRAEGTVETCAAAFLAGCDGAHSAVRERLGIGFPGSTYQHLFYVADVEAKGPTMDGELHVGLDAADFLAMFPLHDEGRARLVGGVRDLPGVDKDATWEDVRGRVIKWMKLDVARVHWFSTYRVHHRVVDRFRSGRAFLLGDAAHIHSPVGGQGMNTGIGDAVNLAWKLADVIQGRAAASLLDSYEPERIAFARRLVASTDRAFTVVTNDTAWNRFVRLRIVPRVVPVLFAVRAIRRFMFLAISQTAIEYRASGVSEGRAGRIRAGDRLPWIPDASDAGDNHEPLRSLDWQVHVYGPATPALRDTCARRGLALCEFPWRAACGRAGFIANAMYLVRPDGYIALADASGDAAALSRYCDARGIHAVHPAPDANASRRPSTAA